ncbi:MAG: YopX family protein [Lachnospiraceae bacterium]|nr:YopX family protein [Lachnospiraceae bacterium]
MAREILFRAKRIDDGEWVEGFLFSTSEHTYIAYQNQFDDDLFLSAKEIFIEVDPETVCQYAGYTDLHKQKAFEHDIVFYEDGGCNGHITFKEGQFLIEWEESRPDLKSDIHFWFTQRRIHIIGNIFDNPELIGDQP